MLLEVKNLSHTLEGGTQALRGVSFSIAENEVVLIAGPNGSGKTVLMKHLNGLLKASTGEVHFKGINIHKQIEKVRQKVGIVFQHSDAQFVGLTVAEDIAFGPENLGWKQETIEAEVKNIGDEFSITHLLDRNPHFLSGGEKKKVAIAGVAVMNPELIIFDEPFAGLDLQGVVVVTDEIIALKKRGHSILLITHDLEKVLGLVDRMIVLNGGTLVYDGEPTLEEKLFRENSLKVPFGVGRTVESCLWKD